MKDIIIYSVKVIGGAFLVCLVLAIVIHLVMSSNAKQLVCTSDEGDITIIYNKKGITGYNVDNMEFDLEEQREYALEIGIDAYLDEFSEWFSSNTSGTCK